MMRDFGSSFDPLIKEWFTYHIGAPTPVQAAAWPVIAGGRHVLVTAPTGSGKTLTAFLWGLNQLITGAWPPGRTRILYVSPLKALNNDIQRNLLQPLAGITARFRQEGADCPSIRVLTRSGDTPQKDRRKMLRYPPEILITTPESLNIMLASSKSREIFASIRSVILDEIHAVADTHRGVHLMTAVERLVPLAGEFQRIALSATVNPLDTMAVWVGGFEGPDRHPRDVTVVQTPERKTYAIEVRFPPPRDPGNRDNFWQPVARDLRQIMDTGRSTLIFTNNRRLCETLTLRINHQEGRVAAYAHHGALSKRLRLDVEQRLKRGDLKAIVATSSLEMGIDIGHLDRVVMVQTPKSVASAVQRAGRANHRVGETSHATLYPVYPGDTLDAAVMARAIVEGDIEAVRPLENPLDVLAQVLVSMACAEPWDMDAMYDLIRQTWSYRNLDRQAFECVLDMLAGKYAGTRIEELKPRLYVDRDTNTVTALSNARMALYGAGGMIPNRGYYRMRHAQTRARIGELDEEFVWEARVGNRFTMGSQKWKIEKITHSDVLVSPAAHSMTATPFWRGEALNRSWHFSAKILEFMETMERYLAADEDVSDILESAHYMEPNAAAALRRYLLEQRAATGCGLPHRRHVVVEHVQSGPDGAPGTQFVIHTLWGGRINRPFAMALEAAWRHRFGGDIDVFPDNNQIAVQLPDTDTADSTGIMDLVTPDTLDDLIAGVLEFSGIFGARFRESAGRAMLIQKQRLNQRLPLWMTRLKAKKLMDTVKPYPDFPMMLEAWRGCFNEEFEIPMLKRLLDEIATGVIAVSHVTTPAPSPMARNGTWAQVNQYMYERDEARSREASRLDKNLVAGVIHREGLRPAIPADLVKDYIDRRQRLMPGYGPETDVDLLHYVSDRQVLADAEWRRLALAGTPSDVMDAVLPRLQRDNFNNLSLKNAFPESPRQPADDPAFDPVQWLGFYGPVPRRFVSDTLGLPPEAVDALLEPLLDDGTLIAGALIHGCDGEVICRSDIYEQLVRRWRRGRRRETPIQPVTALAPFLARFQGLTDPADNRNAFMDRLQQLAAYPAPAGLWETDLLADRCRGYRPQWLDGGVRDSGILWLGSGHRRICFLNDADRDLLDPSMFTSSPENDDNGRVLEPVEERIRELFRDPGARYDFSALLARGDLTSSALMDLLWEAAWRGMVTTDAFETVRRGLAVNFKPPAPDQAQDAGRGIPGRSDNAPPGIGAAGGLRRRSLRRRFHAWQQSMPFPGNWYRLPVIPVPDTPMAREEILRDRARLVLDRYGVVFRELLDRELPGFRWRDLFDAFRIMELSGEITAGLFFHGIPGIQFASPAALRLLETRPASSEQSLSNAADPALFYGLNALDPASVCGLGLEGLPENLPDRRPGNRLVYRGDTPVLWIESRGRSLTFRIEPGDPDLVAVLDHLAKPMERAVMPVTRLTVQTINGKPAEQTPYLAVLKTRFDVDAGGGKIVLYRNF